MPVSTSSLCSWPGVRRWTCGSKKAGKACRPSASTSSTSVASALAGGRELGDPAAADDEVVDALDPGDRVEQGGATQDEVGGLPGADVEDVGEVDGGAHAG